MPQLSGLDLAFVRLEDGRRPMHVGAVPVFDPPRPVRPARIARVLAARAAAIPELTRSARTIWWPPGGAAWADHPHFDADEHVRTHRLPQPHREGQLAGAVATLTAEPLPSGRPAWELHVLSGVVSPVTSMLASFGHRQWTSMRLDADQLHRTRKQFGGTLHDVVLSVIADGLGSWLHHNGTPAAGGTLRVLVSVTLRGRHTGADAGGNHLSGYSWTCPSANPTTSPGGMPCARARSTPRPPVPPKERERSPHRRRTTRTRPPAGHPARPLVRAPARRRRP